MLLRHSIDSLRARVAHLQSDFVFWVERTLDGGDLLQHRTQVKRITDTLAGTLTAALGDTPLLGPRADLPAAVGLRDLPDYRRDIGSVHLLWEFFRDKLAQRDVTSFADHIGSADDLAWACYRPCLEAAVDAGTIGADRVKEPPLVFYSPIRTPFAQARTKTFHPQGLDSRDIQAFADVLTSLPVPVIGVPWASANRVPDLVLVGHETGHVVAEDLGLAQEARDAIGSLALAGDAGNRRRDVWVRWCDEVFADVFGVIATGRAFVSALGAEMAGDADEVHAIAIDENRPGAYPTPTLRMLLCATVLGELGLDADTAWSDAFGALSGDSVRYGNDVGAIVDALLGRSWEGLGGKRLAQCLPWDARHEQNATKVAHAMHNRHQIAVPFSPRVWVAAALHAAEADPGGYAEKRLDAEFARSIVSRRGDAVRSTQLRALGGLAAAFGTDTERSRRDRDAGKALYALLRKL